MEFGAVVHQMRGESIVDWLHIWPMGELKEPFREDFFPHIEAAVNLTVCDKFEPP